MGIEAGDSKLSGKKINRFEKGGCACRDPAAKAKISGAEHFAKLLHFCHTLVTNGRHVAFRESASALRIIELRLLKISPGATNHEPAYIR